MLLKAKMHQEEAHVAACLPIPTDSARWLPKSWGNRKWEMRPRAATKGFQSIAESSVSPPRETEGGFFVSTRRAFIVGAGSAITSRSHNSNA
jgi:hypothetical protein